MSVEPYPGREDGDRADNWMTGGSTTHLGPCTERLLRRGVRTRMFRARAEVPRAPEETGQEERWGGVV